MKTNSQSNTILIDKIGKKKSIKKREKKWVNWVNPPNPQPGPWEEDNPTKSKSNVERLVTLVMRPLWPLRKKIKKGHDLTIKMPKLVTLIVRPKYSYKKQIKAYYETQFPIDSMLNDKI